MNCPRFDGLVVNATWEQASCSSSNRSAVLKISHLLVPIVLRETGEGLGGHVQGAGMETNHKVAPSH